MGSLLPVGLLFGPVFLGLFWIETQAVSFITESSVAGYQQDDGTHSWAVGTPSVVFTIVVSGVTTTGNPTLTLETVDGTNVVDCQFAITSTDCFKGSCDPSTVTCDGPDSGLVTVTFTLTSILSSYDGASLHFTQSTSSIPDWNYVPNTIHASECNSSLTGATGMLHSDPCGYNCAASFSCDSPCYGGASFTGACTAVAEWNAINTCSPRQCTITNNCLNCDIDGGIAPSCVSETKNATCQPGYSASPDASQTHTCGVAGDVLIFDLQCKADCQVTSTCSNCKFEDGILPPTTINDGEYETATCNDAYFSADDPQTKTCTNGTAINFDLNCTVLTSVAGSFTTLPSITNGTAAGSVTNGTAVITTGYNIAYNTTIANESGTQAASSFVTPTDMAIQTTVDMLNTTLMEMSDPNDLETAQTTTSHALVTSKPSLESTAFRSVTTTAAMTQAIYNASSPSTSRSINWTSSQTEGNSSFQGYWASVCAWHLQCE